MIPWTPRTGGRPRRPRRRIEALAAGWALAAGCTLAGSSPPGAPSGPPSPEETAEVAAPRPRPPSLRFLSDLESAVAREHDLVRGDPAAYALHLEERLEYFDGNLLRLPGETPLTTTEGRAAVEEAIRFLRAASPVPALTPSVGMSRAARDHVQDQGPGGGVGHDSSDGSGPGDRLDRYGSWSGMWAENVSYGHTDARSILIQLIVDDGVPGRGHRINVLDPDARFIGVACGRHSRYGAMCTIDYAGGFEEGPR